MKHTSTEGISVDGMHTEDLGRQWSYHNIISIGNPSHWSWPWHRTVCWCPSIKDVSQAGVREWFHYFWTNCFHSSVHITSWIFVTTPENFLTEKLLWLCWTNGIFLIFDSTITEKMFIFSIFSLFFWIICSNFNDFFTRKILNEQNTFVTYVCRVLQTNLSLTCSIT